MMCGMDWRRRGIGLAAGLMLAVAGCAPAPKVAQCEQGVAGLSALATVTPPPC